MPYEIQQSRWDKLLRRVSGSIGPGSRVGTSISDLFPVFDVERVPAELLALSGWRTAAGSTNQNGQAALQQQAQIFNPVASGKIIVVTGIWLGTNTAQLMNYGLVSTQLAIQPAVERPRDSRFSITQRTTGLISFGTNAAVTPITANVQVRGNVAEHLLDENGLFVLSPGFGCQVSTTTVNTALRSSWFWREREAEQSELNF